MEEILQRTTIHHPKYCESLKAEIVGLRREVQRIQDHLFGEQK